MSSPIDINELRNDKGDTKGINVQSDSIIDPNVTNKRDLGNGKYEMDPTENGFKEEKIDNGKSDDQKALEMFDKQMEAREQEVQVYNELLEINGGSVTEEQLREALGQQHITEQLKDGEGEVNEESPNNQSQQISKSNTNVDDKSEDDELKKLEDELSNDELNDNETFSPTSLENNKISSNIENINPISENISKSKVVEYIPTKTSNIDEDGISEEDKDLAELDGSISDESDGNSFEEKLKIELNKKVKPISKKLNIESKTVIQKPVNPNHLAEKISARNKRVFTWPLFNSGKPITIQNFNATELNILNNNARNANMTLEVFKTIYNHIVSEKGSSFEAWCKSTSYFDIDHIWMAMYGACFANANYLPYSCDKCHNVTVTTNTNIMDMVKFKDNEAKERFNKIMNMRDNDPSMNSSFAEEIVPVSDDLAIGFVEPNIYTSIVENSMYDREFREKYSDILNIISYISNIYFIDEDGFRPIATKVFHNNDAKTAKAKVIQYAKIIRSLTSDEFSIIMSYVVELSKNSERVSYQMPEITCDHCKELIPAEDQDAANLVFTRHQLVMFGV